MAEKLTRSSPGTKDNTASVRADLPAAEADGTMTASGCSSLRDTAAR